MSASVFAAIATAVSTVVAVIAFFLAARANAKTAREKQDKVDADAYIRAKDLYESIITQLRGETKDLRVEVTQLKNDLDDVKHRFSMLQSVNDKLESEIAMLKSHGE
jgi:peptidoglycan hydrolase CwlO-like protein